MTETTSYQIKTYSPEFFDEEISLVKEFQERKKLRQIYYTFATETQVKNLKTYRESDNQNFPFVPTDHWYLFDNGEMVGLIHGFPQQNTKRCSISVPMTKAGHEDKAKVLLDTLIESVKERGYDTLVINATEDHVIEIDFVNSFGFENTKVRNMKSNVAIEQLDLSENDKYTLVDYEAEAHREKIINDLYLPKGYAKQMLDNQFDNMATARTNGTVPSWVVAFEGDELVGQSIAFFGRTAFQHLIQFNTVTTNLDDNDSLPLINTIYSQHLKNLPDTVTHVEHFIFPQVLHLRPIYEKLGFKYLENNTFELKI